MIKRSDLKTEEIQIDVEQAKIEVKKSLIRLCCILIVALLSTTAYLSVAWFANNDNVNSSGYTVVTELSDASLFISNVEIGNTTPDYRYLQEATSTQTVHDLFPISTANCQNWYYASGWTQKEGSGVAINFTEAEDIDPSTGLYFNDDVDRSVCAYYRTDFIVYTETKELDVYLDPEEPFVIERNEQIRKVDEALRVALVTQSSTGENIALVYAIPETGKGNSLNQLENRYYCISEGNLQEVSNGSPYVLVDTEESLTAAAAKEAEHSLYDARSTSVKICSADKNGTRISVYLWLEGTDGQTKMGISDNEKNPLSVRIRLVGVTGNE